MNDHGADDMIAMGSWVSLANKKWRWLYAIGCLAKPLFPTIGCRPTFPPQQSYSLTHFSLEKHLSAVTLWFQNTKSFFFLAFNNVTIGFLKRIFGIFVWKVKKKYCSLPWICNGIILCSDLWLCTRHAVNFVWSKLFQFYGKWDFQQFPVVLGYINTGRLRLWSPLRLERFACKFQLLNISREFWTPPRLWRNNDESTFQRRGGGRFTTIMFKNTFQSGFLSILYSIGSKPLQIWDKKVLK